MFTFLPAPWLAAFAALAALPAGAHAGQAPVAGGAAETNTVPYFRSAMDGYKPFTDEKPTAWKEANDTVLQRGGWRAYAKEGTGEAGHQPTGAADPHAGHSTPMPKSAPKDKP
ncbi:hypothetical protein GCM10023165_23640 [Variovorax defluvii]|uniref:Uncharacterized protein n=1 Tax=Variovorax defluvii TaxID=913761 RepID=A0ABP8HPH1_9BURK